MTARILPFATYLTFLASGQGIPSVDNLWLYPLKIVIVLGFLAYFGREYGELKGKIFGSVREVFLAIAVGLTVYVAWVRMDWSWAIQGEGHEQGYDPFRVGPVLGTILAGVRLFGATVVVPIMEELFWRSFLLRYLISSKFDSVPLGTFTPLSFLITVVLFGLEHDLWLAGMMAGATYTLLLYHTGRLWPCILAHGVTNFALGVHVLLTEEWKWW